MMRSVRLPLVLGATGLALLLAAGAGSTSLAADDVWAPPATSVTAPPATSVTAPPEQRADTFPHLRHQGLFPLCTGCHTGIEEGNAADFYPEPASCAGCHDGNEQRRVDWTPTPRPIGMLDFAHPVHRDAVAEAGDDQLACASCHVADEGPRLAVVPLTAGRCLTCHDDDPDTHFTAPDCAQCHRPIAEAFDGEARLASLPRPADHGGGGAGTGSVGDPTTDPTNPAADAFLEDHRPRLPVGVARCATCHTQDRCLSCHVSGDRRQIQAMPPAPSDWTLPAMEARYPIPEGHTSDVFEVTHGRPAPSASDCSTCHTRNDCASCHLSPMPASAEALPERPQVRAPGVGLEAQRPVSHETPFFMTAHTILASSAPDACSTCHTQSYCADCHDAQRAPGYHPQGFALRHAASAGSQSMECSNCHNTAAFCRQCHVEVGFGGVGRLGPGYHDAEPLWLIRHGQGARQGLEQCASCHTQKECLQCHSQTGAFRVSPHGPDFDPARAQESNPWICAACHLGTPGG